MQWKIEALLDVAQSHQGLATCTSGPATLSGPATCKDLIPQLERLKLPALLDEKRQQATDTFVKRAQAFLMAEPVSQVR